MTTSRRHEVPAALRSHRGAVCSTPYALGLRRAPATLRAVGPGAVRPVELLASVMGLPASRLVTSGPGVCGKSAPRARCVPGRRAVLSFLPHLRAPPGALRSTCPGGGMADALA